MSKEKEIATDHTEHRNGIVNVPMAKQRDIQTVTTEIRTLTQQGQRLILEYAIEIGRRLHEAKSMLPHGQWGSWLRDEVEFSQSTANNFMRMFDEYGADQISIFGAEAKSQAIGNLQYTKALKLLALPAEEREEFVKSQDVANMSSRELEKAIRERDAARKQAQDVETRLLQTQKNLASAQEDAASARKKLNEAIKDVCEADDEAQRNETALRKELEAAKESARKATEEAQQAKDALQRAQENAQVPKERLDALEKDAMKKAKEEYKQEKRKLIEAAAEAERKAKAAQERAEAMEKQMRLAGGETAQFKLLFRQVQESFAQMQQMLERIGENDAETAGKLRNAVKALAEKIGAEVDTLC